MKHVIVTVHLVIPIEEDTPGYKDDAVGEILTGNLEYNKIILDWGYAKNNMSVVVDLPNDYEEGDFIDHVE